MKICKKCGISFVPSKGKINYCSLQCRNSREFNDEAKEKKRKANLNSVPWNKNKKLNWVTGVCLHCKEELVFPRYKPKKYHPKCWLKCSGGYRKGSGVGKKGWYKGYWCDSSYELAWVIYNIEHDIKFKRNKKTYEYVWENKIRKYTPDFDKNGVLFEIKGFVDKQTEVKLKTVPNLHILFKKDLKNVFDYVHMKYGKDFIKMYEK